MFVDATPSPRSTLSLAVFLSGLAIGALTAVAGKGKPPSPSNALNAVIAAKTRVRQTADVHRKATTDWQVAWSNVSVFQQARAGGKHVLGGNAELNRLTSRMSTAYDFHKASKQTLARAQLDLRVAQAAYCSTLREFNRHVQLNDKNRRVLETPRRQASPAAPGEPKPGLPARFARAVGLAPGPPKDRPPSRALPATPRRPTVIRAADGRLRPVASEGVPRTPPPSPLSRVGKEHGPLPTPPTRK